MLLNPRTPVIIGTLLLTLFGWLILEYSPAPAKLAEAHGSIDGLSKLGGCATCHRPEGLATGCLSCHEEIASELKEAHGLHQFLLQGKAIDCTPCHVEHKGTNASLITVASWGAQVERAFRHPHTTFNLKEKHEEIECEKCHVGERQQAFSLPSFPGRTRARTFLGVKQDCEACHEDPHAGGLSGACDACHGQHSFRPTVAFDHGLKFPLDGGHASLLCDACHVIPPPKTPRRPSPFPFDAVRGSLCDQCHTAPHVAFKKSCEECHQGSDPLWSTALAAVTPETHARSGFHLTGAHAEVECRKCHPASLPYEERYPDPGKPGYPRGEESCEGCHVDAHGGQFLGSHSRCRDCHGTHGFQPTSFDVAAHGRVYPLEGGHAAVSCTSCHKVEQDSHVRQFVGTPKVCAQCHENPHGGQFAAGIADKGCVACHATGSIDFTIRPFDHASRTKYPLTGAHARAACNDCHAEAPVVVAGVTRPVRVYQGNPRNCDACHRDPHRGQFAENGPDACGACHTGFEDWKAGGFNHDKHSRFPLVGAHAKVACARCHVPVKFADGVQAVIYKPLGRACRDCHEVPTATND